MRTFVVAVAVLVCLAGCNSSTLESSQRQECERDLIAELKSPSTYKRVSADDLTIEDNKPPYFMVAIEYDAVNSYNAPIRNTKYCHFRLDAQGKPTMNPFEPYETAVTAEDLDAVDRASEQSATIDNAVVDDDIPARARAPAPVPVPAPPRPKASRYPGNCYKDYCPCEPPQGGADQILCDELEEGKDIDVDLMIAGRGAREVRRQLREQDF